jgi:hypothetical protein
MKKTASVKRETDDLGIPELGPEFFDHAVMGRHYAKMMAKSNVVRIAPDMSPVFPNEAAVNQALRELIRIRETLTAMTSIKPRSRKTA